MTGFKIIFSFTKSRAEALGKIKVAYTALYGMGILVLSVTGLLFTMASDAEIITAIILLLAGVLYLYLGLMVKRRSQRCFSYCFDFERFKCVGRER